MRMPFGYLRNPCLWMTYPFVQEVAKALADPELNRKLGELAIQLSGSTPEELGQLIRNEHDKWGKLIKDVKLNLEQ